MDPKPSRPFVWVDDDSKLDAALSAVEGAKELGVDAEMNGLFAWRARVCVLQIATEEADLVIDTLAIKDTKPLARVLTRPDVVRYTHGAAHDVKCLKAEFGFGLSGLFDTYVASQLLGIEKLGYGDVVQTRFGETLDKKLQTTDWGKRPLTQAHVDYLRADVRFLLPLGRMLRAELAARDLLEEAACEWGRVEALPADDPSLAPDAYLRPRESRELPPAGLSVLRELFLVRDEWARKLDRPPFKIAGEPVLVEIARKRPATEEELAKVPGLPRSGPSRLLADFLGAVERGVAAGSPPPIVREHTGPRPDPAEIRARREREETLRSWRKRVAAARSVPPMAVLPTYLIEDLVRARPASLEDLATRPGMIPKRVRLYARELLSLPCLAPTGGPS